MSSRRLNWVSALDNLNARALSELDAKMTEYYASTPKYYEEIDFTGKSWRDDVIYRYIASSLMQSAKILEVGCGRANILKYHPELESRYTGLDFSPELTRSNQRQHPSAEFCVLNESSVVPFSDSSHDAVVSIFVLEHCVYPHLALNEWMRVLRPNGRLLVYCPDFMGRGRMSSQRCGFRSGTGRDKLREFRLLDALVTGYDAKIRIPAFCQKLTLKAKSSPQFYINLNPTCFTDPFQPDVDAVYVTNADEIHKWLEGMMTQCPIPPEIQNRAALNRGLFFSYIKR